MTSSNTEKRIAQLTDYFAKGSTKKENRRFGLELEHIIVSKGTKYSVSYYHKHGIEDILQTLVPYYDTTTTCNEHLIGLERPSSMISLEPGAQFEIALPPLCSIKEAETLYLQARKEADEVAESYGYEIMNIGYHPRSNAREMELIPKKRYRFMNRYFQKTGNHGIDMMRGSAATQVSLDYTDEADFMDMFRLANILGPVFALLTDNTPMFMGNPYNKYMARTLIWNDVDKARSMVVPTALDGDFGWKEYAAYVLKTPPILIMDKKGDPHYTDDALIETIYGDTPLTEKEIEHILSMFFPDVRLKNFMEIRMSDSMPLPYVLSYVALLKGIFYSETNKKELLQAFSFVRNQDNTVGKLSLINDGYKGKIYGKAPEEILELLFSKAEKALTPEERPYLLPLKSLVTEETTLAKKYNENHF